MESLRCMSDRSSSRGGLMHPGCGRSLEGRRLQSRSFGDSGGDIEYAECMEYTEPSGVCGYSGSESFVSDNEARHNCHGGSGSTIGLAIGSPRSLRGIERA